jgi:uncharacterized membrane protein
MPHDKKRRDERLDKVEDAISGPVVPEPEKPAEPVPAKHVTVELFGRKLGASRAVYALLSLVFGAFCFPLFGTIVAATIKDIRAGGFDTSNAVATIDFILECACLVIMGAGLIWLAVRQINSNTKDEVRITEGLMIVDTVLILSHMLLFGMSPVLIVFVLIAALLIAMHSFFDPELTLERENKATDDKTLKEMLAKGDNERTKIPGHRSGKGYISLNFFNLFWIFTICSILGLVIETIVHIVFYGGYQDRAGMLWGPLSPIYGFGGLLMTIALNRFHSKPWWLIFLVSAVIGGAFEFFTSWFMQTAFGITAWNYSGTFLNIDGRTNFFFMCCWGILGLGWVKFLLPVMLWVVKKIPWGWRYTLTTIVAVFMIFDGAMTLTTIDCWYMREANQPVSGPVEQFCAEHYDNKYMEHRFQTMTMDPSSSARSTSKGVL